MNLDKEEIQYIKDISKNLPVQIFNKSEPKILKGSELLAILKSKNLPLLDSRDEKIDPKRKYKISIKTPEFVNHEKNLMSLARKDKKKGTTLVRDYVNKLITPTSNDGKGSEK